MYLLVLCFPASMDEANSEAAPQNWWMGGLVLPNITSINAKRKGGSPGGGGDGAIFNAVFFV